MIFVKGEYIRLIGSNFPDETKGRIGQIHKVLNLDRDEFPYLIIIVSSLGKTEKFLCKSDELQLIKWLECQLEIMDYLKSVQK